MGIDPITGGILALAGTVGGAIAQSGEADATRKLKKKAGKKQLAAIRNAENILNTNFDKSIENYESLLNQGYDEYAARAQSGLDAFEKQLKLTGDELSVFSEMGLKTSEESLLKGGEQAQRYLGEAQAQFQPYQDISKDALSQLRTLITEEPSFQESPRFKFQKKLLEQQLASTGQSLSPTAVASYSAPLIANEADRQEMAMQQKIQNLLPAIQAGQFGTSGISNLLGQSAGLTSNLQSQIAANRLGSSQFQSQQALQLGMPYAQSLLNVPLQMGQVGFGAQSNIAQQNFSGQQNLASQLSNLALKRGDTESNLKLAQKPDYGTPLGYGLGVGTELLGLANSFF